MNSCPIHTNKPLYTSEIIQLAHAEEPSLKTGGKKIERITKAFIHTTKLKPCIFTTNQHQENGEGTGPAIASDLLMLPIPHIMQPGADSAENLAPQRSQTSYPIVDKRLRVAAQN